MTPKLTQPDKPYRPPLFSRVVEVDKQTPSQRKVYEKPPKSVQSAAIEKIAAVTRTAIPPQLNIHNEQNAFQKYIVKKIDIFLENTHWKSLDEVSKQTPLDIFFFVCEFNRLESRPLSKPSRRSILIYVFQHKGNLYLNEFGQFEFIPFEVVPELVPGIKALALAAVEGFLDTIYKKTLMDHEKDLPSTIAFFYRHFNHAMPSLENPLRKKILLLVFPKGQGQLFLTAEGKLQFAQSPLPYPNLIRNLYGGKLGGTGK